MGTTSWRHSAVFLGHGFDISGRGVKVKCMVHGRLFVRKGIFAHHILLIGAANGGGLRLGNHHSSAIAGEAVDKHILSRQLRHQRKLLADLLKLADILRGQVGFCLAKGLQHFQPSSLSSIHSCRAVSSVVQPRILARLTIRL